MSAAAGGIDVTGTEALQQALKRIADRCENPDPALQDIADHVAETSRTAFEEEADLWGNPWHGLAESTKKQRRGSSPYQILRDNSNLINSITGGVRNGAAVVGAGTGPSRDYARIHLFGGMAGRGRQTEIPARPYLPVNSAGVDLPPEMESDLLDILTVYLEQG